MAKSGTLNNAHIDGYSCKKDISIDICTYSTGVFHSILISFNNPGTGVDVSGGIYDPAASGSQIDQRAKYPQISISSI
ncbi:hypothetical protein L0665_05250 [Methanogenium marinum]|uniref:Uncharacterized protein n=1 Tax=Methanogenium marinum TaxID=348610 RepID=A0A9Q4KST2_9EURY|nr:hypothetical protein [Methanogenium marinum]MDE4908014.1 hypothetical protein [Methanogenium marinum]